MDCQNLFTNNTSQPYSNASSQDARWSVVHTKQYLEFAGFVLWWCIHTISLIKVTSSICDQPKKIFVSKTMNYFTKPSIPPTHKKNKTRFNCQKNLFTCIVQAFQWSYMGKQYTMIRSMIFTSCAIVFLKLMQYSFNH